MLDSAIDASLGVRRVKPHQDTAVPRAVPPGASAFGECQNGRDRARILDLVHAKRAAAEFFRKSVAVCCVRRFTLGPTGTGFVAADKRVPPRPPHGTPATHRQRLLTAVRKIVPGFSSRRWPSVAGCWGRFRFMIAFFLSPRVVTLTSNRAVESQLLVRTCASNLSAACKHETVSPSCNDAYRLRECVSILNREGDFLFGREQTGFGPLHQVHATGISVGSVELSSRREINLLSR